MCKRIHGEGGKKHFACLNCRKCFKQPGSAERQAAEKDRPFLCPECGEPMCDMGSDFKAPRQRDTRQWIKVEILAMFGFFYRSGCCDGPGYRPAALNEVEEFLVDHGNRRDVVRREIERVKRIRRDR
jgi:hypothetical protein